MRFLKVAGILRNREYLLQQLSFLPFVFRVLSSASFVVHLLKRIDIIYSAKKTGINLWKLRQNNVDPAPVTIMIMFLQG